MKDEIIINMPRKIDNSRTSFEFLIYDLYNITKEIRNTRVILNFEKTKWLEANLTAVLGSIFFMILKNHNYITIRSIDSRIRDILIKNKFLIHFGLSGNIKDKYETTVKYTQFVPDERIKFQEYVKDEFIPKINLSMTNDFEKELRLNLEEVFQNARTHGKCEYIFVCGQSFYKSKKVKFTIVDLGKTIPENVRSKIGESIDDKDSIEWATKDGNSTKTDVSGGIGLYQLSEFLKENSGKLQIISSHGYWEQNGDSITRRNLYQPFYGTIVSIEVNINNKIYLSTEEKNNLNLVINDIF